MESGLEAPAWVDDPGWSDEVHGWIDRSLWVVGAPVASLQALRTPTS